MVFAGFPLSRMELKKVADEFFPDRRRASDFRNVQQIVERLNQGITCIHT